MWLVKGHAGSRSGASAGCDYLSPPRCVGAVRCPESRVVRRAGRDPGSRGPLRAVRAALRAGEDRGRRRRERCCGPGEVTAYLHELGIDAFGIDLSPGMVEVARCEHPGLRFEVGSMTDLDLPVASVTGLLAWQSLIHVPDGEVPTVLAHFHRALRPGGPLQLLFHVGDEAWLKTEGYGGYPMRVHIHPRRPDRVACWLRDAGFEIGAQMLLDPDGKLPHAVLLARRQP